MIQKNPLNIQNTSKKRLNNTVIIACAGSGKTWSICNDAIQQNNSERKVLMISYTHKGVESIRREYAKQNSGVIDENIRIYTWFQFLLRELIKPYQKSCLNKINIIRSFDFSNMYGVDYSKKNTIKYFLCNHNDVKANRASEFAIFLNQLSNGAVIKRLEEAYSSIYIDELQDLVGKDIELLELLYLSSIEICCVGDYKQATLKTHNAKSNKNKGGVFIFDYLETIKDTHNLEIIKNNQSRRFIKDIADFANMIYPRDHVVSLINPSKPTMGVYLIHIDDVEDYIRCYKPNILRFDRKTGTMGYAALNFGVSKGMTMDRVLIFPNGPLNKFLSDLENKLSAPDKYYVGVTRARYSLAFAVEKFKPNGYFEECEIDLGDKQIRAMRFVASSGK